MSWGGPAGGGCLHREFFFLPPGPAPLPTAVPPQPRLGGDWSITGPGLGGTVSPPNPPLNSCMKSI